MGHSPFNLFYDSEVILPVEVGIPFLRMTVYDYDKNEEQKKVDLDLLPESRENTPTQVHLQQATSDQAVQP